MTTEHLWAPWRMEYIRQLEEQGGKPVATPPSSCFLCDAAAVEPDSTAFRERLLLVHDGRGMILLNRYPYTSGHLLVAISEHVPDLTDLSPPQRAGLIELTAQAQQLVRVTFNPQGINIGVNLGRCAGAGLPGHLHLHIVPRWNGDTNFMQTVGSVRVIPQAVEESYQILADAVKKLEK